jgi:hypothetical protein
MPADVYGQIITDMYQRTKEPIYVGDLNQAEVEKLRDAKQEEDTGVVFFDKSTNILSQWSGSWTSITQASHTGSCISRIARFYLYDMAGGPKLKEGMGHSRERSYYEDKEWLSKNVVNKGKLAIDHFQNTGISGQYLWWPLITAATYWRREKDIKAGVNHNWSKIYLNNPDFVEAGKSVYIPVFPSGNWRDNRSLLSNVKDIWRNAYISFKDLYGDSCKIWRAMYY